ncbi:hypothetical protein BO99DRAFT_428284 [Aspergillus violaceofuscus CBS 115571]|uniref:Condensation domain-containing protein n=1 Tax=Aspergillus violaceofuscus (strain CBS 115571) TaxID=1450538 RepID=A0A2V5HHV6_ASPV1|nr:hypothetical protein BO99DRAFT_428284 [Aspergillus violaceofuscus CBS 115571]
MATLIKTAWATVLHQETHSRDIVFAQIVNARDIDLPDLDSLIGPCLNIIPVRVSFPPAPAPDIPETTSAILTAVQTQHAQFLECSTCQWQEIVTQCTDWSKNSNSSTVSSIVLHENFDAKPEVDLGGGRRWKMRSPILSNPPDQTIFLTTWPERDVLCVMFSVSSRWLFANVQPKIVIHTASPKFDAPNPILYKLNVEGTRTLLQIAQESGT